MAVCVLELSALYQLALRVWQDLTTTPLSSSLTTQLSRLSRRRDAERKMGRQGAGPHSIGAGASQSRRRQEARRDRDDLAWRQVRSCAEPQGRQRVVETQNGRCHP